LVGKGAVIGLLLKILRWLLIIVVVLVLLVGGGGYLWLRGASSICRCATTPRRSTRRRPGD